MIAFLRGRLAHYEPSHFVVECSGVGYQVMVTLNAYEAFRDMEEVQIPTYFQVTETSQVLYGFRDRQEKAFFTQLIAISGVGGMTALTILSTLRPEELETAVRQDDVERLKQVKGIGAKTAGRILLELKGRLPKLEADLGGTATPSGKLRTEALEALTALGFSKQAMEKKIDDVMSGTQPPKTVEELIKHALKN